MVNAGISKRERSIQDEGQRMPREKFLALVTMEEL